MSAPRTAEEANAILLEAAGGMERIRSWFSQRTFSPERRAASAVSDYAADLIAKADELRIEGASDEQVQEWCAGFVKRWLAYQHAGARTLNWMITGPARFPVERNRKRMETEHKRGDELAEYTAGAKGWLRRKLRSAEKAAASAEAKESGVGLHEVERAGVRLVHNTALDRVQLIFPGKPDPETIRDLKKSAFRWSPREGAWQRQLTRNGIWAAEGILAALIAEQAA